MPVVPQTPGGGGSKLGRPISFTPTARRPPSSLGIKTPSLSSRTSTIPAQPPSTTKKYKAALSTESKVRTTVSSLAPGTRSRSGSTLAPVPPTPNRDGLRSRSRTPVSPGRRGDESPLLAPSTSEMDVSNVDPEEVLVDYKSVEPADLSAEMDEEWVKKALGSNSVKDFGKEDKVMVSVRMRPTKGQIAWVPNPATASLKLDPSFSKHPTITSAATTTEFNFDAVLTGTPNKPIYTTVARSHVQAAMEGYNAVIFAYGQTASGKTFTLSGDDDEPGIIPRSMKEVFGFIKRTPEREYLLRCSYLEIYNENIHDLLAPPSIAASNPVQIQGTGAGGSDIILTPLREEVITSLKGVKAVLKRGEGNRRTACTDWNERSSRSHSVFRLVIESRERGDGTNDRDEEDEVAASLMSGRQTPGLSGRQTPGGRRTPGLGGRQTPGLGGPRLQSKGGRSVQTSVLSLIDLAGSEKATSDKDRTREGRYINTSLLTLGTVIGTLADNAAKKKSDHVPFRNSKLTRMLQPSLSGNARISVICTINPDVNAIAESTSTLLFAKRIKSVQLHAQKKEIIDTDALIERYRNEIEELKNRLAEREAEAPVRSRRLSAREQVDESKAMRDLNSRIQQLTKLILTSQTVDEGKGDDSRPTSPQKIDFDMSPYQLHQELLTARVQLETQASQILSLEAALVKKPVPLSTDIPDSEQEKDQLLAAQMQRIRELEDAVKAYENDELPRNWEEDEKKWKEKLEDEMRKREEKERWAEELIRQLEKERKARKKLEDERKALATFVGKFDSSALSSGSLSPPRPTIALPTAGGAAVAFAERQQQRLQGGIFPSRSNPLPPIPSTPGRSVSSSSNSSDASDVTTVPSSPSKLMRPDIILPPAASTPNPPSTSSPSRQFPKATPASQLGPLDLGLELDISPIKFELTGLPNQPSLLEQQMLEDEWSMMSDGDVSFGDIPPVPTVPGEAGKTASFVKKMGLGNVRAVLAGGKENLP